MHPSTILHQQPTVGSNAVLTQTNDSVPLALPLLVQTFSLPQAESWRGSQGLQTVGVRIRSLSLSLGCWEEAGFSLVSNAGSRVRVHMLIPLTSLYLPIQQPSDSDRGAAWQIPAAISASLSPRAVH